MSAVQAKRLMQAFGLDAIYGLDAETYYDKQYSLKNKALSTTDYIVDERFKLHMMSVQRHDERRARVFNESEFKRWAKTIKWDRVGVLAHHCHFDSFILSHHYGIQPKFLLDTLSMARPVMPVHISLGLDSLCKALNLTGKVGASSLVDVMGVRYLSLEQYKCLAKYAGNDIEETWRLFWKLLPYLTLDELRIIDLTVKMYARPSVLINAALVQGVHESEVKKKAELIKRLRLDRKQLTSNEQFAQLLEAEGVRVPEKISKTTGRLTLAMSKGDLEFKHLLKHPRKRVRDLMEARLAVKTSILETRSKRMEGRAKLGPQPVYLKYWAAKTGRTGGGDLMNWSNFNRGSDLRTAIHAPPGHTLVIPDQSQVEARICAWTAGQTDVIEAFRLYDAGKGPDVYRYTAAGVYGKLVERITADERFAGGKVTTLSLQFGAGAPRYADTLRLGQYGPPVDISDLLAQDIVRAWRLKNSAIVSDWRTTENAVKSAFIGQQRVKHGVVVYEGVNGSGFMHMPNGTSMRYDQVRQDDDGALSYLVAKTGKRTRVWGGYLVENRTQALARAVFVDHQLKVVDALPGARLAMTTYDEMMLVVLKTKSKAALKTVIQIMSVPPKWAAGLPLGVKVGVSDTYVKE